MVVIIYPVVRTDGLFIITIDATALAFVVPALLIIIFLAIKASNQANL